MVESEHQERVGVRQNPFVNRQFVARLVDALEHCDRVAGGFAGNLLEAECGAVKKLQRAGDPLEELRSAPFRRLVGWPQHIADFGHRREAVLHRPGVALGFPRVTPCPVDAQAAFARRVFAGDVGLVVGACWRQRVHGCSFLCPLISSERDSAGIAPKSVFVACKLLVLLSGRSLKVPESHLYRPVRNVSSGSSRAQR